MFVNNFESSKAGIDFAAEQLIAEGVVRKLCPLEQYARVNALKQACDKALERLQDAAVKEALDEYPKAESSQFEHNGLVFQFKRKQTYNFEGIPAWDLKKSLLTKAEKVVKDRKTELKAIEEVYRTKHPEFKPEQIELSVAFCAK